MASLTLQRPRDGGGILRRLRVEVDGHEVGALKQGESVRLQVAPGPHRIVGRMDWTTTPTLELDVADRDVLEIEVALPVTALWNMMLRPQSALTIRRLR